jgi:hypothetical protein
VLSRLFRRLFLERLAAAYQAGRLEFFADHVGLAEPARFKAYVAALRKLEWVVYAKRPFGGHGAVLAYLSRYTHRIAIANSRLIAFNGTRVTFKWKDYRAKADARAKDLMAAPMPEVDPPAAHDTADPDATADHPPCPRCGGRMIIVEVFARGAAPRGPPYPGAGITDVIR